MPLSAAVVTGGIIVAITGNVIQAARAAMGPQMFAAMGQPAEIDVSAWTGVAIALSGAFVAVFTAIGKVVIDLVMKFGSARVEVERQAAESRIELERKAAAARLESERAAHEEGREAFTAQVDALLKKLAEMAEELGTVRHDLAEAKRIVEHTDKGVSQIKTGHGDLLQVTAEKTLENEKRILQTEEKVSRLSGDDIPVPPEPKPKA